MPDRVTRDSGSRDRCGAEEQDGDEREDSYGAAETPASTAWFPERV